MMRLQSLIFSTVSVPSVASRVADRSSSAGVRAFTFSMERMSIWSLVLFLSTDMVTASRR